MKRGMRFTVYALGFCVLALGIALNTKTTLGVAPINSIAVVSAELTGAKLAVTTFIMQLPFIAAQAAIKGKNFKAYDLLQVVVSVVFCVIIGAVDETFQYVPSLWWQKSLLLLAAISCTATGLFMVMNMRLVPGAPDAFMIVLSDRTGRDVGFWKNIVDVSCVAIALSTGLIFGGRIIGIGLGTLLTMIAVGRIIWLLNRFFQRRLLLFTGLDEYIADRAEEAVPVPAEAVEEDGLAQIAALGGECDEQKI